MAILLDERDWIVRAIPQDKPDRPTQTYVVRIPSYEEKGFYRQVGSFTHFFHSMPKKGPRRNIDPYGHLLYVASEGCYFDPRYARGPGDPPFKRVRDIFALYEAIGYARHKRRWLKLNERVPAAL